MEKGNPLKALILGGILMYGGIRICNDREAREALESQRSQVAALVVETFSDAGESSSAVDTDTGSF